MTTISPDEVLRIVSGVLEQEVAFDDDLFALGVDSLSLLRIAFAITATTGREVAIESLFSATSIRELASQVA